MSTDYEFKIICPQCGSELPENSQFCNYCGCKINNALDAEKTKEQNAKHSEHTDFKIATPSAKKKVRWPLIIGIAAVAAVIVAGAVTFYLNGTLHGCTYNSWQVVKEPTCVSNGAEIGTCWCGDTTTRIIAAKGHTEVIDSAVNSTCANTGLTEGKHCSDCEAVIVPQNIVEKIPHTYSGESDIDCNVCGAIRDTSCSHAEKETIPGKAASCKATGLTAGTKCKTCGETIVAQETIPMSAHTYDNKYDENCNVCGHKRDAECAHSETEVVKGREATCTATGLTDGTKCKKCGETIVAQTNIPKKAHNETTIPAVAATCTTTGLTAGTKCKNCGTIIVAQTTITASGHKYDNGVIVSKATCATKGTKKYSCTKSNCNYSYTVTYSLPTYTATEINNQALKYVGEITVYDKNGYALGAGTGFVMSADGKIVTNYHVIEGAYYADIVINDTTYIVSSVLAYDANIDLAILKINASGLSAANICKLPVNVGETVYAIGSSRGLTNTFSQGIVTYADRIFDGVSHVQHDASITHGNSGGPLINVYGEVIGINTWGLADSQNLNFAVATSELENLDYLGTPVTLAELNKQNNNAFDALVDFILMNGEQQGNYVHLEIVDTANELTKFSYDLVNDRVTLGCMIFYSDGSTSFAGLIMEKNVERYFYSLNKTTANGVIISSISGWIEYQSFTKSTVLGYDSYDGPSYQELSMREEASSFTQYLVTQLNWLATNYLDLTVADFGFASF